MSVEKEIAGLFERWNAALQSGDPAEVVKLYASDAILLPTVSNRVRSDHAGIRDYFAHFLAKGPRGVVDESHIRLFGDIAIHSGKYTFSFSKDPGKVIGARFTFVYRRTGARWLIVEHHSSVLPEPVAA